MPNSAAAGPLAVARPDDICRVRDVLDGIAYDFEHVRARIGTKQSADLGLSALDRPRLLRCTKGGDPLDALIRVFLAGVPVPLEAFRRAVAPMSPGEWAGLGLVEIETDRVWRLFVLKPIGPHVLVHDAPPIEGRPQRDLVMGVSGSSLTLSSVTVRPPVRLMLDLGTGSGYLALLAAAHSQHVIAADVNPRAVAAARFNAILNRVTNIETAQGSLFEPVGDRRFDLITSNPPFVVSPQNDLVYRDSGLERDAICEQILRAARVISLKEASPRCSATGSGFGARIGSYGSRSGSTAPSATCGSSIGHRSSRANTLRTGSPRAARHFPTASRTILSGGSVITTRTKSRPSMSDSSTCDAAPADGTGCVSTGSAISTSARAKGSWSGSPPTTSSTA